MQTHSPAFIPAPPDFPALLEDRELLCRSASDDGEAFNTLFQRHRDGLQGFLFRKLHSHEDAEDALTLTFCNAWRARCSFRGSASGKAWLYSIATRVALDILRARRRRPADQELDAWQPDLISLAHDVVLDPVDIALNQEYQAGAQVAVHQAIARLPQEERRLLELFYFDGYNYDEISSLLGVSRSQVRGRLHRIRGRMKRDLVERQRWQPA